MAWPIRRATGRRCVNEEAEKIRTARVCFVDTSGAYPGVPALGTRPGQAIAESIMEMMGLKVPVFLF